MEQAVIWHEAGERVSPETCASIVERALLLPSAAATVGFQQEIQQRVRKCEVRWLKREDDRFADVRQLILRRIEDANRKCFGFDLAYLPNIQFALYEEGGGYYTWHTDDDLWKPISGNTRVFVRKLSCVISLSAADSYEGGNLELDGMSVSGQMRGLGATAVFPAFVRHRVTPVTRGKRYSLAAWMEGPGWR